MLTGGAGFAFFLLPLVDVALDVTHNGFGVDALAGVIVGQRRFYGLLGQHTAVDLGGRQTVQCLHNGAVGQGKRLVDGVALDHFGGDGTGGDGGAAAKRFEFYIGNGISIDFKIHLHDIAAAGVSYLANAVRVCDLSHIALFVQRRGMIAL